MRIYSLSEEFNKVQGFLGNSTEELEKLKKIIKYLETEVENYSQAVSDLQDKLSDAKNQLEGTLDITEALLKSEADLKNEVGSLKAEINALNAQVANLKINARTVPDTEKKEFLIEHISL
jgi:chromosome segregation ATPase